MVILWNIIKKTGFYFNILYNFLLNIIVETLVHFRDLKEWLHLFELEVY